MLLQTTVFHLTPEREEKGEAAYDFTHVCGIKVKATREQTHKLTDTDDPAAGTRGDGGRGGRKRKSQIDGDGRRLDFGWRKHSATHT